MNMLFVYYSKKTGTYQNPNIKRNLEEGCGINSTTSAYSGYVTEYLLPQSCEMPLSIVVDDEDGQIWYVSTKRVS
jgi:hypothetical protein